MSLVDEIRSRCESTRCNHGKFEAFETAGRISKREQKASCQQRHTGLR